MSSSVFLYSIIEINTSYFSSIYLSRYKSTTLSVCHYCHVNSTLAVSNIRNRTYTNCEVYLIDYGYGNFKEKIHFME